VYADVGLHAEKQPAEHESARHRLGCVPFHWRPLPSSVRAASPKLNGAYSCKRYVYEPRADSGLVYTTQILYIRISRPAREEFEARTRKRNLTHRTTANICWLESRHRQVASRCGTVVSDLGVSLELNNAIKAAGKSKSGLRERIAVNATNCGPLAHEVVEVKSRMK